ncbi:MAG: hypothetical protein UW93_C0027G0004 [Parcubacteria group bacterium GW2011_GWC1_45_13]|nr:MAG: hypothetical protein UW93_C0027G0004 [Parcubacteria group bacterium GW2011_GWC1_45_13]
MKKLIVISGSPGSGKSTICSLLKEKLNSPYIEFSSLQEFHLDNEWKNWSEDGEKMAFENLIFVLKNYIKHGYKNVILTDLRDSKVQEIPRYFENENFVIITLTVENDDELKKRIVDRNSGFKNVQEALDWNKDVKARPTLQNEYKIDNTHNRPEQTLEEVLKLL